MSDGGYGIVWNNGSRQPMFLITTSVLLFCSTLAVGLRLYCRARFVRYIGLDDKFIVGALVVAIALGIQNVLHCSWGTGRRLADLNIALIMIPSLKHWYAYQIVYPWALFFVKASILALYHRIFTYGKFRYFVYGAAAFVSAQTITVFECGNKPWRAWSPTELAKCNNLTTTYFVMASVNIFTDVFILAMPLRAFGRLKLERKRRIALLGVFLIGGIAVIASIVRLYALWLYANTKDAPYDSIFILLLSQIEINAAVLSASAPALRPLLSKKLASSSYFRSNKHPLSGVTEDGLASQFFSRSRGQIELQPFPGGTRNTSEESILRANGIMKTVHLMIKNDYAAKKEPGEGRGTQEYE